VNAGRAISGAVPSQGRAGAADAFADSASHAFGDRAVEAGAAAAFADSAADAFADSASHAGTVHALVAGTRDSEDTRRLAAAMARVLGPGDVVLLIGDLGAGKTTFAQGLAVGLGVSEAVTSPTFTLLHAYRCDPAGAVRTLLHADLYRLVSRHEVDDLALDELVERDAALVVEWGDAAAELLGRDALRVVIEATGAESERAVRIEFVGSWRGRAAQTVGHLAPWSRHLGRDG
jgi:tRNA threonylcarbamoyladenosine biosynthesis protein TsaE